MSIRQGHTWPPWRSTSDSAGSFLALPATTTAAIRPSRTVTKPAVMSALALDRALVPRAQDEVGERRQGQEYHDAGARDHQERGEHTRDLHRVARFEDAVGEPRLHAARAR